MPENILIFQNTDTKLSTQNSHGEILSKIATTIVLSNFNSNFNFKLRGSINETLGRGKDVLRFVTVCSPKDWMQSSVIQLKYA